MRNAPNPCPAWMLAGLAGLASCTLGEPELRTPHTPTSNASDPPHSDRPHEDDAIELGATALERAGIRTELPELRALPNELETTGAVDFDQDRLVHVGPRVEGRAHTVHAALGQTVRSGEPLVVIESVELGRAQARYLEALVGRELARRTVEREEALFDERVSAESDLLAARAEHQGALAELRSLEQELRLYGLTAAEIEALEPDSRRTARLSIPSPIDGRVIDKHVARGEWVTPETTLFTLADLSRVWIWIDVYERDLAAVHRDDQVEVRVDAYPDRTFSGRVAYVGDRVDTLTRAVRARVDVDNRDRSLKPGMFARIRLLDPHAADGGRALTVPTTAVRHDDGRSVTFVELGPGSFRRRVVRIGRTSSGRVEVLDGLAPDERVVIDGGFLLESEHSKDELGGGHGH